MTAVLCVRTNIQCTPETDNEHEYGASLWWHAQNCNFTGVPPKEAQIGQISVPWHFHFRPRVSKQRIKGCSSDWFPTPCLALTKAISQLLSSFLDFVSEFDWGASFMLQVKGRQSCFLSSELHAVACFCNAPPKSTVQKAKKALFLLLPLCLLCRRS
eukprot:5783071-Amphidinium_carterae.1